MSLSTGIANTPLINYFFYKQSTFISSSTDTTCFPILSISDGGNGQLVITTTDTTLLSVGVAVTLESTTSYDGNYTIISKTATTFSVSGIFVATEAGCWHLDIVSIGANAGDPLDYGQIFFYDNTDKITFQNTYNDRDLTVLNPNPILLDANGSWPPIYLIDMPYYVVIKDKFNNLVATLENYLPSSSQGGGGDTEIPLGNLLPTYGFDYVIYSDFSDYRSIATAQTPVGGGWIWKNITTQSDYSDTYRYNNVSLDGVEGNPKNEVVLRSTNNISGQTTNELLMIIGNYNYFQNQQLIFSIFGRTLDGTSPVLNVRLIREKNGVQEAPITIGTITLTPSRTQQTVLFTVPSLVDTNYSNNDSLLLVIELPLNTDFEYGFTGTWLQLSSLGQLDITELAYSENAAKSFFSRGLNRLADDPIYPITGLPATFSEEDSSYQPLRKTGEIILISKQESAGQQINKWASPMGAQDDLGMGFEFVRDEPAGYTVSNRIIDYLRDNVLLESRLTFLAVIDSVNDNQVNVETGIGVRPASAWASLATPRVTLVKSQDELIYGLEAYPMGNGKLRLTFTDNFETNPQAYNPFVFGNDIVENAPEQSPIISSYGVYSLRAEFAGGFNVNYFLNFWNNLGVNVISIGSPSTPAIVEFTLPSSNPTRYIKRQSSGSFVAEQPGGGGVVADIIVSSNEIGLINPYEAIESITNAATYGSNYFSYNSSTDNPGTQPVNPARVIKFGPNGPTGTTSTLTIPLSELSFNKTPAEMARLYRIHINNPFLYQITVAATPNNGDILEISNGMSSFNVIFWDTGQLRPANPSSIRKVIYVPFESSNTIQQIALALANSIERGVAGIPKAADVGLSFPDELAYYMTL